MLTLRSRVKRFQPMAPLDLRIKGFIEMRFQPMLSSSGTLQKNVPRKSSVFERRGNFIRAAPRPFESKPYCEIGRAERKARAGLNPANKVPAEFPTIEIERWPVHGCRVDKWYSCVGSQERDPNSVLYMGVFYSWVLCQNRFNGVLYMGVSYRG